MNLLLSVDNLNINFFKSYKMNNKSKLFAIGLSLVLISCTTNQQQLNNDSSKQVIKNTPQIIDQEQLFSANYGNLLSSEYITNYSLDTIKNNAVQNLCMGMNQDSKICQQNLTNLNHDFAFDLKSIKNNKLGVTSVNVYNITYDTLNMIPANNHNYQVKTVSGSIFVPHGIPANKIKGVILYYHPTMYNPYDYSPENNPKTGLFYPAMYASQGYIVVLPDLLGFGVDANEAHPYMYPKVNVAAGINMLRATNNLLTKLAITPSSKLPLILNGFSEGGMLSQWASYLIQSNTASLTNTNTKLALTLPMSGAFDLSDSQIKKEYANESVQQHNTYLAQNQYVTALAKPGLIAYAVNSYNYYTKTSCQQILQASLCNFVNESGQNLKLMDLFLPSAPSTLAIQDIIYNRATKATQYAEYNNSIANIVLPDSQLSLDYLQTYHAIDLKDWQTQSPIHYLHLDRDSLVTPFNSLVAYKNVSKRSKSGLVSISAIHNDRYQEHNSQIDHNHPIMYAATVGILNKFFP